MIEKIDPQIGQSSTGVAIGDNITQNISIYTYKVEDLKGVKSNKFNSNLGSYDTVKELVDHLAKEGAFSHDVHRPLPSGYHVVDYIDLRSIATQNKIALEFAKAILTLFETSEFDGVLGVNPIALSVASWISDLSNKPCSFYLSPNLKPLVIENILPEGFGSKVLLIEDVIATTESSRSTINAIQKKGFTISGICAIVVREGNHQINFDDLGIKFRFLLSYSFQNFQPSECPACMEGKHFK